MRILFLTSRLPFPPNRGDKLRVFNFIKSISRQHDVHLISFISNRQELRYKNELLQFCKEIRLLERRPLYSLISAVLNSWRSEPLQSLYYRSPEMHNLVDKTLASKKFDAIYVHLFRMAQFALKTDNHYRILDLTDVISKELSRSLPYRNQLSKLLYSFETQRISKYEVAVSNLFDEVWLISDADLNYLATKIPETNVKVVTNGIDTDTFHPIKINAEPYRIVFTGHMGVLHNIDAARFFTDEVFPAVQEEFPESRFIIVGADPAQSIQDLSTHPNVEVLGYVENLNNELNASQIFVAPLRFAAGIQNKVLEAMAAGIPVVATSIVNEGLNALDGKEILIADTPDDFSKHISLLFRNKRLHRDVGISGLEFVRKNFSWDNVLNRLNQIEIKSS